ncbi:MAG: hypothetical protein D6695_07755 [Planctomycetota bacterium]|nr:MAG: hypothetical protein D6695_07755 [Planctomycetota bacterium]
MSDSKADTSIPSLVVPMSADEIVSVLDRAARRGRLPGFEPHPSGALFLADAWGTPFDSDLIAVASPEGERTRLTFTLRLRRRLPIIYAIVLGLTIWPGVTLTDRVLSLWFEWYHGLTQMDVFHAGGFAFFTYAWYLPLTVLPLPWLWRSWMRRARATATVSALETIAKIAKELGVEPPPEAAAVIAG